MDTKLVLIDASKYTNRIISVKLKALNWSINAITEHKGIFGQLNKYGPTIILYDPDFPGVDGLELCKRIQQYFTDKKKKVVLIFHSKRNTKNDVLEALRSGANDYILKPSAISTIIRKINKQLEKMGLEQAKVSSDGGEKSLFNLDMDPATRIRVLLKRSDEVKAIPYTVTRTLKVTNDPKTGAKDLAQIIESDTAVTAMVLRRANSAHYGADKRIHDIRDCIVRLGFADCKSMVMGISVIKCFGEEENSLGFTRSGFWEHSLGVGLFAQYIATNTKICDPNLAFIGGMLHDIGKLLLDEHVSNEFEKAVEWAAQHGSTIGLGEREIMGITHADVGEALLQQWEFPTELVRMAANHNSAGQIAAIEKEYQGLSYLVNFCNDLVKALRMGFAGDQMLRQVDPQRLEEFGLENGIAADLVQKVETGVKEFKDFLGMPDVSSEIGARASDKLSKNIFFFSSHPVPVNLFRIYLERSGYALFEAQSMEAVAEKMQAGETGTVLLDAQPEADMKALASSLDALPGSTPVLLLGSKEQVAQWPEICKRKFVTALARPADGNLLIKAINEGLTSVAMPTA